MKIDTSEIIFYGIFLLYVIIEKFLIPSKLEKIKSELSGKLQEIKSSLSKEQFIHKLQFEKEFTIYEELWTSLINLRGSTARLISPFELNDSTKTEKEIKEEKLKDVTHHMDIVNKIISNNKPFYDEEVYENASNIIRTSISQIFKFHYPERDVSKHFSDAKKKVDEINEIINSIEKSIRKRIKNMRKAKLVG